MINRKERDERAFALYDSGWRGEDREELIEKYGFSEDESWEIVGDLEVIEMEADIFL